MKRLCLFLCLLAGVCSAQTSRVASLTIEDGLSAGSVLCVLKDSKGYVYLGTLQGVDRFDGQNIVNIGFPDRDIRKDCSVNCLAEESPLTLLAGGKLGLWRLDKLKLTMTRLFADDIDGEVNSLVAADSTFYIGTDKGLYTLRGGRLKKQKLWGAENNQNIRDLYLQAGGNGPLLWVALTHGIIRYQPRQQQSSYAACYDRDDSRHITKIAVTSGRIFVGTTEGLLEYEPSAQAFLPFMFPYSCINDLRPEGADRLLLAVEDYGGIELSVADKQVVRRYFNQDLPHTTRIRFETPVVFYRDNTGVNWFGYKFFGLDYTCLNRHIFHTFGIPGVLNSADHSVRSFLIDGNRVLLGTRKGLCIADRQQGTVTWFSPTDLKASLVAGIVRSGRYYIVGTVGSGLHAINCTTLQEEPFPQAEPLTRSNVYRVTTDSSGQVWACSSEGLACFTPSADGSLQNGQLWLYTAQNSQLPSNEVLRLTFEPSGRGWIGTYTGLCVYNPYTRTVSTSELPAPLKTVGQVQSIMLLDSTTVLFGPNFGKPLLYHLETDKVETTNFGLERELPTLMYALRLGTDRYMLCTDNGLLQKDGHDVRFYEYIDGLESIQFQPDAFCVRDDTLWAGTNSGLGGVALKDLTTVRPQHLSIIASDIMTDHFYTAVETNKVNQDRRLKLSRRSNELTLRFAPLVFGNTKALRYQYRLKGYEDEWHDAAANRTIFYGSLPAGDYTLEIEAIGMPEINGSFEVSVPYRYIVIMYALLLILFAALLLHIAYCTYFKKPYVWQRLMPKPEKYQKSRMEKAESDKMAGQLRRLMDEEKPYLKPDLQMADLARAIGCSNHTLSQLFTQVLGITYYDFIAEYRIREFMRLAKEPEYEKYTINALSEICGFRSRTPFLTSFKKIAGMTPKEYMKSIKK